MKTTDQQADFKNACNLGRLQKKRKLRSAQKSRIQAKNLQEFL